MPSDGSSMLPFSACQELVHDLESSGDGSPANTAVPGRPTLMFHDVGLTQQFLKEDLLTPDLETMSHHLWIMTTFSSANINALHRQRVKGREIILTEESRLHLVWIHDRIFIKPLPRYLLSHALWKKHLNSDASPELRAAALGFLRTYRHLIQHESDLRIAQQDALQLVPADIDWASFSQFRDQLAQIEDEDVSGRYWYGELRLTRLNLYAPLLLRRFHYEQVHGQYGDIFGNLYGPILFIFAIVSIILNAMQVELAVRQVEDGRWNVASRSFHSFSVFSLIAAAIISSWLLLLWLWIFLDEWIYTVRRRFKRKRQREGSTKC